MPPFERNVNTVFQDYALFPHMTVADNVAYGLRVRGVAAAERSSRAPARCSSWCGSASSARGGRAQLSGGQRQRVALARALINQPRVLLLDEPLGALDLKLREEMQAELKALQQRLGITFVFVTHDQGEALSMADRVAVFSHGRIEQLDTPRELYTRPQTAFVASFVGSANVVGARRSAGADGLAAGLRHPSRTDRAGGAGQRRFPTVTCAAPARCSTCCITAPAAGCGCAWTSSTTLAVARAEGADGAADASAAGSIVRLAWRPEHAVPLRD